MTWRQLFEKKRTPPPIDLRRHAEILEDLRNITEKLRSGDPLTRMVRGTWNNDQGKDDATEDRD